MKLLRPCAGFIDLEWGENPQTLQFEQFANFNLDDHFIKTKTSISF